MGKFGNQSILKVLDSFWMVFGFGVPQFLGTIQSLPTWRPDEAVAFLSKLHGELTASAPSSFLASASSRRPDLAGCCEILIKTNDLIFLFEHPFFIIDLFVGVMNGLQSLSPPRQTFGNPSCKVPRSPRGRLSEDGFASANSQGMVTIPTSNGHIHQLQINSKSTVNLFQLSYFNSSSSGGFHMSA